MNNARSHKWSLSLFFTLCPIEPPFSYLLMTKDLSSPWNKEDTLPWAGINKFNAQAVINLKWGIRYFTVKYPATQFSPERSVSYPLPVRERKGYYLKKYAEVRETIDDQGMSLKYNPDKECTPHPIDILVREL